MTEKPNGKSHWSTRLLVVVGFLCLYVGAYYLTVCPYRGFLITGQGPWHSYQIGGHYLPYAAHTFFKPIHLIDRRMRPKTWWTPDK